ncbi:MAG: PepSY-associated region [Pseudomonadota bacterium]
MAVFAVLIGYWCLSGLLLASYDLTDDSQSWAAEGGGPGARPPDLSDAPLPRPEQLRPGIHAVLGQLDASPASVRLYAAAGHVRIEFADADGDRKAMRRFDAVSGQSLDEYFPPEPGPGTSGATRDALKTWHRGNVAGLAGQLIGIVVGLAVVVMALSGLWIYLGLYRARRRIGRSGLFWKAGPLLPRLHRSVAVVAAAFLLNMAVTGVVLGISEFQLHLFLDHHLGSPPYPRPGPMPPLSDDALRLPVAQALDRAFAESGNASLRGVELFRRNGKDMARITRGGSEEESKLIDLVTGETVAPDPHRPGHQGHGYLADWHQIVKRLHRGDVVGHFAGRYIDLAAGLSLLFLLVSGSLIYLKQGRRQ